MTHSTDIYVSCPLQVLGDIKNLALHLSHLRERHREEVNKLKCFQSSNASSAVALPNKSQLPKKNKHGMTSSVVNAEEVSMQYLSYETEYRRESSPVFSESNFSVDEFNCKVIVTIMTMPIYLFLLLL